MIFQACTDATTAGSGPSLELRLSTSPNSTYSDLLAVALPRALELAAEELPELRQHLPPDYLRYMGISFEPNKEQGIATQTILGDGETSSGAAMPLGVPPALRDAEGEALADVQAKGRAAARERLMSRIQALATQVRHDPPPRPTLPPRRALGHPIHDSAKVLLRWVRGLVRQLLVARRW